jgi:hypothetical protein
MVLHMLRWVCGDSAFFAGVREYLHDPALAYGYAHTSDLKQHLETASGRNLDGFFADWFYGEGYPSYQLDWSKTPDNVVTVKVKQRQSHPSVAFFEMPLQIRLSNGPTDSIVVLNHTANGQVFTIPLDFNPYTLEFDPNLWIVSRNNFVQEFTTTGEPKPPYELQVIPNPSPKDIRVQLLLPTGGDINVTLWQADGKLVASRKITAGQGYNNFVLEGPGRASGLYQLRIEGKGWVAEKTVLVL